MSETPNDSPACALRAQQDSHHGPHAITHLLASSKNIAVVGLSSRPERASHHVAQYLQSVGYKIFPVNPGETEVHGEKVYARLEDVPAKIDIVDLFRKSSAVPDVVESAIAIGARAVWMQEGVINEAAAQKAREAGLTVVMEHCILKEHIKRGKA